MLRIKLVKSPLGNTPRNRATVAALGLRRMHQVVTQEDTPSIRGMIHHVKHLLEVTEVAAEAPKTASKPRAKKEAAPVETPAAETQEEA